MYAGRGRGIMRRFLRVWDWSWELKFLESFEFSAPRDTLRVSYTKLRSRLVKRLNPDGLKLRHLPFERELALYWPHSLEIPISARSHFTNSPSTACHLSKAQHYSGETSRTVVQRLWLMIARTSFAIRVRRRSTPHIHFNHRTFARSYPINGGDGHSTPSLEHVILSMQCRA